MTDEVRFCPGCKSLRPREEVLCGNEKCGWDLTLEPLQLLNQINPIEKGEVSVGSIRICLNGHPLDDWDEMCLVPNCGAIAAEEICITDKAQSDEIIIDGWSVIERIESDSKIFESYIVRRHDYQAQLTHYCSDTHPTASVYEVLKRLPKNYVPELLVYGEWEGRRYEVMDLVSHTNLLSLLTEPVNLETIQQIVKSVGKIISSLAEHGLRHGNICPENILITHHEPLDLVLSGFQYSCVSNYDIDTSTQPSSARYTAPELIAGGISNASDWWSLGIVILQLITQGQCFEGINEKAFRIHVVTRGIALPKGIDLSLNILLRGLLARDPDQRWQWTQVQQWLAGEIVEVPSEVEVEINRYGASLDFKEQSYVCPKSYALAAAEAANWEEAKELFIRGVIATWLEDRGADPKIIAGVRTVASIDSMSDDFKHALALMWMNTNLPLIFLGEIVNSAWLLQNPVQGYELVTGPLVNYLRQMNRELYLSELHERIERARERATILEIELDEESFKVLALVSSRYNLERQWAARRRLFPDSDHGGVSSLIDRQKISDEDLIILLSAGLHQYQSAEQIIREAKAIAEQVGITFYDELGAQPWFDVSRRELYRAIDERIANYSQCGIPRIDEWANDFVLQRRMSLSRALILLSVSKDLWKEPDRLQYVSRILDFFEKRALNLAQRGPLVRMLVSKSNSRVDLASISGNTPSAASILDHLISRTDIPIGIDRIAFENHPELEKKLRHLVNHANTYRRDTGIDSLYLGFPFLLMRDSHSGCTDKKPKIAPILLCPIKINIESRERVTILFDRDREEVRINPALARMLGSDEIKVWMETINELLGRTSIRTGDVIDAIGVLAEPVGRSLDVLPNSEYKIVAGHKQVAPAAVFFHAEFMGQALSEDLRQMRKVSLIDTSLETILRVSKDPIIASSLPIIPEKDRYFTVESDPSQEKAVFCARQAPGLLIEGPPGTGKSQTIVNIIGDCIGRNQTVLVICQKAAALEVLAKRLNAEGLRERYFYITHVNKDRNSVLQSIRSQIDGMISSINVFRSENVERQRNELAEIIEKLENEIDNHHEATHAIDDGSGLSYRLLIGQLIDIEEHDVNLIDVPLLRGFLAHLNPKQITLIEESCSPLAKIWLESRFEENSLKNLKIFSSDNALVDEFTMALDAFIVKENRREELSQSTISFEIQDPSPHQDWVMTYDSLFKTVNWENISFWFHLFSPSSQSKGSESIKQLEDIKSSLNLLDFEKHDYQLSEKLIELSISKVKKWKALAKNATPSASFFNRINPLRLISYRRVQKFLTNLGETATLERVRHLKNAAELECQQRPIRKKILKLLELFSQDKRSITSLSINELKLIVDRLKDDLVLAEKGIHAIYACPRQKEIDPIVRKGFSAYQDLLARYSIAFNRHEVRCNSLGDLEKLIPFFGEDFFNTCLSNIQNNRSNLTMLQTIVDSLPTLSAYQEFRVQVPFLSPETLNIFTILRQKEKELKKYPISQLEDVIRRLIAREARLGWKDRIEQTFPILRLSQKELSRKIQNLSEANTKMRVLNEKYLAFNIDIEKVKPAEEWEDITRLRGPRARRLREIIERGWDMG